MNTNLEFSKISQQEMLFTAEANVATALDLANGDLKRLEVENRKMELELQRRKLNAESELRIQRKLNEEIVVSVKFITYNKMKEMNPKLFSIRIKRYSSSFNSQILSFFQNKFPDIEYIHYQLYDNEGMFIESLNYNEFLPKQPWTYDINKTSITHAAPSNWSNEQLNDLKIEVIQVIDRFIFFNDFLTIDYTISLRAKALISDLVNLNNTNILSSFKSFREVDNNKNNNTNNDADTSKYDHILKNNPIAKAVCLLNKYSNHESLVNLFITFLFEAIGFYSDRLFAFPDLVHHLNFRTKETKIITMETTPDFTIMDIFSSYMRIVIIKDKNLDNYNNESKVDAQLIAEAIAIYQANELVDYNNSLGAKRKLPINSNEEIEPNNNNNNNNNNSEDLLKNNILGIKVRGLEITFYIIPITEHIINTMSTLNCAKLPTFVKKYGPFDFNGNLDRKNIIETLDIFHQIITK